MLCFLLDSPKYAVLCCSVPRAGSRWQTVVTSGAVFTIHASCRESASPPWHTLVRRWPSKEDGHRHDPCMTRRITCCGIASAFMRPPVHPRPQSPDHQTAARDWRHLAKGCQRRSIPCGPLQASAGLAAGVVDVAGGD
ncbi:hypothetical protein X797_007203 [Metarhizium robertsii]|uniref:Uncharacterized protein n=1 Tax=Metarhizium robertsii TaxID=568076 RepID=A0A0A1USW5_9HYPO|nr:hypothetical protein X797_007203 [Metarhizium robertsii]